VIAFGVLAGALALVGVFGIVSFLVHQRSREFGIRIALGARRADIRVAVLQESVRPALAGLALGVFGAWVSASVVESTVFGWQTSGLQAVVLVVAVILGVAVVAALAPAARAARIDPAMSLRID
jgi:ABC-type antimicrobial peptide transport system permease subunit